MPHLKGADYPSLHPDSAKIPLPAAPRRIADRIDAGAECLLNGNIFSQQFASFPPKVITGDC